MTTEANAIHCGTAKVLIISGFFGAGKTTLIKNIMSFQESMSGTVVMVNKPGKAGIDGGLLEGGGVEVVELTDGCIGCNLRNEFRANLIKMVETYSPKRIIIEALGAADPSILIEIVRENSMVPLMHLEKVITVLEGKAWEIRQEFGPLFLNQLKAADLLILNKIDLLQETTVAEVLSQIHEAVPDTRIIPTMMCQIDPESLWAL